MIGDSLGKSQMVKVRLCRKLDVRKSGIQADISSNFIEDCTAYE
jgi:hypothetical protein